MVWPFDTEEGIWKVFCITFRVVFSHFQKGKIMTFQQVRVKKRSTKPEKTDRKKYGVVYRPIPDITPEKRRLAERVIFKIIVGER